MEKASGGFRNIYDQGRCEGRIAPKTFRCYVTLSPCSLFYIYVYLFAIIVVIANQSSLTFTKPRQLSVTAQADSSATRGLNEILALVSGITTYWNVLFLGLEVLGGSEKS